jgi:hypothetical protein
MNVYVRNIQQNYVFKQGIFVFLFYVLGNIYWPDDDPKGRNMSLY